MIAAFLILRLRSVLGRHRDASRSDSRFGTKQQLSQQEKPPVIKPESLEEAELKDIENTDLETKLTEEGLLEKGFTEIVRAYPGFDPKEFITGVGTAFEIIIKAFSDGDREQLKALLSHNVYSNFSDAIANREENEERLDNTLIRIVDVIALEAFIDKNVANITVKIISEQINATLNIKNEVIDGNSDYVSEITDIWTFARDTNSQDPNWELVATRSLD